jgi:hypothetical protein
MGKTIGKLALIAGVIALNFIPGVGTAVGLALTSAGLSAAAVTAGATIEGQRGAAVGADAVVQPSRAADRGAWYGDFVY